MGITINEKGLKAIETFLAENHKLREFSPKQIQAWAAEAEENYDVSGSAHIEISSTDANLGRPVIFDCPKDGYEYDEVESRANQIVDAMTEDLGSFDAKTIADALCDGATLAEMGITDEDQSAVEVAYYKVTNGMYGD